MYLKIILDFIQAISVIIASIVAVYGISSWRRETAWKRKYEIAEEVLSCLYDIAERFDVIRNNLGVSGEGNSSKNDGNKPLSKSDIVYERYEAEKTPFVKLKSLKYRFMLLYGKEACEPINEIIRLKNKLLIAGHNIQHYELSLEEVTQLPREELEKRYLKKEKYEAIIWADYGEKDDFKESVHQAINKVENICSSIMKRK